MKKFEYKEEIISYSDRDSLKLRHEMELPMLQKEGLLGWELVAVTKTEDKERTHDFVWWENKYYFKREVLE